MAKDPGTEIGCTPIRVDELASERVPTHRVDGEVTTTERLLKREVRVDIDLESAVAGAGHRVLARERDVEVLAVDLER